MDVATWLRDLGLERYEPAFRDNDIDGEVLPNLTAEDLVALGVISVGHRRRLLDAIAALRDGTPPPGERSVAAPPAEAPDAQPAPAREPAAERRQLTVMFADLVGSTALSGRLDPEEMSAVVRAYQSAVAGEVTRFGGHVAKYLGDGVLAYFGYPKAHEDAAERAVRAGLTVVEAVGRLAEPDGGTPLAARVGIATGLVVVGELIGEGAAREEAVVGETPNLAARLQALAEPGSVVIGAGTRRLVGNLFDLVDLGAQELKGFAAPVPAWRVLRPSRVGGRFEARQTGRLTPLVGREDERSVLFDRWARAKGGEGQVVLLSGEAGIGKSRLVEALCKRAAGAPHRRLRCQCSPYHVNSALHPIIDQLERAAGFQRDDTAEVKLGKLEALLACAAGDVAPLAPLLADLLAIPAAGRYPPLNLTPKRQKARTFEALLAHLTGPAAGRPVLLILEDAHWLDPTSLELFDLVVERARRLPVLTVITSRPEFSPPWSGHAHLTLLTLNRLDRRQAAAVVERIAGKPLPAEVVEEIVAKADGVPLFVEELTRAVLESGLLRDEGDRYGRAEALPPLAIPATLQDSLMARLDRLAPAKEVAQIGAAIGREFAHDLLAAVAPLGAAELREALRRLTDAELIFRRGMPPEVSYSFKHALVRDAAYESLLRSRRQRLHARIAQVLEERFPATAEAEPELLAHHCTEAGLVERAVAYWHRAGQRVAARFAHKEAIAHLRRALDLLKGLPETPERAREEIRLQTALGTWLMAAKGPVAEMERAYARARDLSERFGDGHQLYAALWGLWYFNQGRMELNTARDLSYELLDLARRQEDRGLLLQAHHAAWTVLQFQGDLLPCWEHHEQGIALYDPEEHRFHASVYGGHDPGVCCRSRGGLTLWLLGYPDRAAALARDAVRLARELAQPFSLVIALGQRAYVHQLRGEAKRAEEEAEATIAVSDEQGLPLYLAAGSLLRGWAVAAQGQPDEGTAEVRRSLRHLRDTGSWAHRSYYLALLAEICGQAGRFDDGLRALAEAFAFVEDKGERWWEAELHRLQGELLLARAGKDGAAEAEACFRRALDVARRQGARAFELRAAASLARLWCDRGRRAEAADLLAPVYGWFTEGFDTPDLVDARALLAEVG